MILKFRKSSYDQSLLRKPAGKLASLVVIRERSENRGCGGGVVPWRCRKRYGFRHQKGMVLRGNVPCGKAVTVGIDSP